MEKVLSTPKRRRVFGQLRKDRWMYFMMIPGILYFVIFRYWPMWGVMLAFMEYNPFLGFFQSQWVGTKHFARFFGSSMFATLFRNTLLMGTYNLVFFFPVPILLAILLNEMHHPRYKRLLQTLLYLPHFMSWVVIVGISYILLTTEGGVVNAIIERMGGESIAFLMEKSRFRSLIIIQTIWKESGWGTIIFLATLSGIDPQLYEAASIDGANRWHQALFITFPALAGTITILLILRLGSFLDTGFQHIYLMTNAMNRSVAEVFDTYVYAIGINQGQFSYSTAVGLFKSAVGLFLVLCSNKAAKLIGQEGIY